MILSIHAYQDFLDYLLVVDYEIGIDFDTFAGDVELLNQILVVQLVGVVSMEALDLTLEVNRIELRVQVIAQLELTA